VAPTPPVAPDAFGHAHQRRGILHVIPRPGSLLGCFTSACWYGTLCCCLLTYRLKHYVGLALRLLRDTRCGTTVSWLGDVWFLLACQLIVDSSEEGTVSVILQIPGYMLISVGEVLVSITGLEFACVVSRLLA